MNIVSEQILCYLNRNYYLLSLVLNDVIFCDICFWMRVVEMEKRRFYFDLPGLHFNLDTISTLHSSSGIVCVYVCVLIFAIFTRQNAN